MNDPKMLELNREFYDPLWTDSRLIRPERFNTWPLVQRLSAAAPHRLEVGPGLRPRLPLEGTTFVDLSRPAVAHLCAAGYHAIEAVISDLPFPDASFDLVCALDIVEHVDDDDLALSELSRVAAPGSAILLSMPLHPGKWIPFDDVVGHRRRYEPAILLEKLATHGFAIESSTSYGMQPGSSRLLDLGIWCLTHRRKMAMRWYNNIFMPMGLYFQKKLEFTPGLIDMTASDEIVLLCRKA